MMRWSICFQQIKTKKVPVNLADMKWFGNRWLNFVQIMQLSITPMDFYLEFQAEHPVLHLFFQRILLPIK